MGGEGCWWVVWGGGGSEWCEIMMVIMDGWVELVKVNKGW